MFSVIRSSSTSALRSRTWPSSSQICRCHARRATRICSCIASTMEDCSGSCEIKGADLPSSFGPAYPLSCNGNSVLSGEMAVAAVVGVPVSESIVTGLTSCSPPKEALLNSVDTGRRLSPTKSEDVGGALLGGGVFVTTLENESLAVGVIVMVCPCDEDFSLIAE